MVIFYRYVSLPEGIIKLINQLSSVLSTHIPIWCFSSFLWPTNPQLLNQPSPILHQPQNHFWGSVDPGFCRGRTWKAPHMPTFPSPGHPQPLRSAASQGRGLASGAPGRPEKMGDGMGWPWEPKKSQVQKPPKMCFCCHQTWRIKPCLKTCENLKSWGWIGWIGIWSS